MRQTDDGSFELVLDREGLQEVSEEEVSVAEVSAPEPQTAARTSRRVLIFSAIGVAVLLALAGLGWWALAPSTSSDPSVDEVAGFKPYVGGGDSAADNAQKKAERRARIAAIADAQPPDEEEVEVVEQEITGDEPGWELSEQAEDGVIVEVEGTDPEEATAEAEASEDLPEPPAANSRSLMPQNRLDALRNANLGRTIQAPRVPGIGGSGIGARKLPIRNLRPAAADDGEEVAADEDVVEEEEVVDEEVVEEELQ